MILKHTAIPFEISDVYEGLAKCSGLMKADDKALTLEFQTEDAMFGFLKSDIKNVRIKFLDLSLIEFKKGWFSSKIIIKTNSFDYLKDFPKIVESGVVLKISNNHKDIAREFVSDVMLRASEEKLDDLEKDHY